MFVFPYVTIFCSDIKWSGLFFELVTTAFSHSGFCGDLASFLYHSHNIYFALSGVHVTFWGSCLFQVVFLIPTGWFSLIIFLYNSSAGFGSLWLISVIQSILPPLSTKESSTDISSLNDKYGLSEYLLNSFKRVSFALWDQQMNIYSQRAEGQSPWHSG